MFTSEKLLEMLVLVCNPVQVRVVDGGNDGTGDCAADEHDVSEDESHISNFHGLRWTRDDPGTLPLHDYRANKEVKILSRVLHQLKVKDLLEQKVALGCTGHVIPIVLTVSMEVIIIILLSLFMIIMMEFHHGKFYHHLLNVNLVWVKPKDSKSKGLNKNF